MIGVLVSHDDHLARTGLGAILSETPDLEVKGTCTGNDVAAATRRCRPDVVVVGVPACLERVSLLMVSMKRLGQRPEIVLLVPDCEGHVAREALRCGAAAVLSPDAAPKLLRDTIAAVTTGNRVLTSTAMVSLMGALDRSALPPDVQARAGALTRRETEVCGMLTAGLSNAEIGRSLLLSSATVKDHVSAIYTKLGTRNRVQTAVLADRLGMGGRVARG
ncbi:response regulator transcription factor [Streptomyces sp. NPDC090023]|uniref:response regulator transcription factor n=1 Tax=unclassified Streptomyces TaxID=2593676 RepID=UPI003811257F